MNPEPADIQVPSKALPEQAKAVVSPSLASDDVNFLTLIYRWQPMGYRIVINLPFVSDDITPLFAIKNGPYIPPNSQFATLDSGSNTALGFQRIYQPIYPLPSEESSSTAVTVTRYDCAPTLAICSWAYRYWKGSMKYRLRSVANFIAQGYVFSSVARQLYASELHYSGTTQPDLRTQHRVIPGLESGFRRYQQNSYAMSDLSMYRHIEVEVPFEYPLPFYDQYRALDELSNRVRNRTVAQGPLVTEPNMGDNFIIVSNRGGMASPTAGAQVVYELEYCPGDDFTFTSEFCFSRAGLEVGNNNISQNYIGTPPSLNQDLPFTYPTS